MGKIIRLTESELTNLVRMVVNETQSAQAQQLISKANKLASTGCFNEKTTPKLVALAKALRGTCQWPLRPVTPLMPTQREAAFEGQKNLPIQM